MVTHHPATGTTFVSTKTAVVDDRIAVVAVNPPAYVTIVVDERTVAKRWVTIIAGHSGAKFVG